MRNQVVTLEDESDPMVPVRIPIAVGEFFRADPVDQKIATAVMIQPADDIEQRGFSAAGRSQNRNEFGIPERQGYAFQCVNDRIAGVIIFLNIDEFQHALSS